MSRVPGSRSQRRLTPLRVLVYRLAAGLGALVLEVLWRTCRIRVVNGEQMSAELIAHGAVIPVYWHQHLLMCSRYLPLQAPHGLKLGFMISPSVDGEAATMLARIYGGEVIRGSGSYTGARAVRHLYRAVSGQKLSPVMTPDGPRGPRFVFKPGALFLSQLCSKPIVPLSYAARPAWVLRTWDKFVIPVPFSRVVIAVGEPLQVAREITEPELEALQVEMQHRLHATYRAAAAELARWKQGSQAV